MKEGCIFKLQKLKERLNWAKELDGGGAASNIL